MADRVRVVATGWHGGQHVGETRKQGSTEPGAQQNASNMVLQRTV